MPEGEKKPPTVVSSPESWPEPWPRSKSRGAQNSSCWTSWLGQAQLRLSSETQRPFPSVCLCFPPSFSFFALAPHLFSSPPPPCHMLTP